VFVIGVNIAAIFGNIFGGGSVSNSYMATNDFSVLYLTSIVIYFGIQISKTLNKK